MKTTVPLDLHRPCVDNIVLVSDSGKPMYRESDLIDVWFDSGAMPFAQVFYPHIAESEFAQVFPADFIAEGVDQTRGWFFTLHAIAAMVADSVAFKNVISNGLVLDKNGNKMSKRLNNAVEPFAVMNEYGADALRWYMVTNAQPWDNLKFDIAGVDEVRRKFFGTLFNTYSFFALYANVDAFSGQEPPVSVAQRAEIDQWIISTLNTLIKNVENAYESYEPTQAGRLIQDFVCDHLSNWYVRLNRKRFWGGTMNEEKLAAYQTLYECLQTVCVLASPIAPFFTDKVYCDLQSGENPQNKPRSVHFADFPKCNNALINKDLEDKMQLAQQVTSMILALRRKAELKVRQPLAQVLIPVVDKRMQDLFTNEIKTLISAETNVKQIVLVGDNAAVVTKKAKPNFKTLGAKCGKNMKEVAAKIAAFTHKEIAALEREQTYLLALASGENITLSLADIEIITEDIAGSLSMSENGITLALDITLTPALRYEGIARELVNRIQNLRKDSGFEITDRINLQLSLSKIDDAAQCRETAAAITAFADYIKGQVLATTLNIADSLCDAATAEVDNYTVEIKIARFIH
jgi:isoleucyl-tRNA synthetase